MTRRPTHPGLALRRIMKRRFITQQQLADALQTSRFTVNQIVRGYRTVTPDMALRLSVVLGTSAELWLNLQMRVDLFDAQQEMQNKLLHLTVLCSPNLETEPGQ